MRILITGGNGMVARSARRIFEELGDEVHSPDKTQLDITEREAVHETIISLRPDAVLNCAAFTNVDLCESEIRGCFSVNALGVGNLAAESAEAGARFVTISTDYVFDGESEDFYTELDVTNPINVYGRSKLEGERLASTANSDSLIIRSGWIYGHGGTNFLSVIADRLSAGEKVTAIGDSFGTPTFADDLVRAIRSLMDTDSRGVFHLANAGSGTSYHGFAVDVATLLGLPVDSVGEISENSLSRPAPRPRMSRLKSVRLVESGIAPLRDCSDALADYIATR